MQRTELLEEATTRSIIGAFFEVYNALGFGFLEQVYAAALADELAARGHRVDREVGVRVRYKGRVIAVQRIDMIVDEKIIVEVKATEKLHLWSSRQVYNYLKATDLDVGLLLHFGPQPSFFRLIHSAAKARPKL